MVLTIVVIYLFEFWQSVEHLYDRVHVTGVSDVVYPRVVASIERLFFLFALDQLAESPVQI